MTGTNSAVNGVVQCDVRLDGKTVIVTGANTGIGYETTLDLVGRGAKVIMACRDVLKAEKARSMILEQVQDAKLIIKSLDLASLSSVRKFSEDIYESEDRLDILINNAGVMLCPPWKTEEGFEIHMGVNHIGHFLLTNLMLDLLKRSAPSRVVIVSSLAYITGKINWDHLISRRNYDAYNAYSASKLANILHCHELSRRLQGSGVTCNVLHPGMVNTDLERHMDDVGHMSFIRRTILKTLWPMIVRSQHVTAKQGAQTSIYCAIAPELETVSGKYFSFCKERYLLGHARNEADAERLWKLSEEWTEKDHRRTQQHTRPDDNFLNSQSSSNFNNLWLLGPIIMLLSFYISNSKGWIYN